MEKVEGTDTFLKETSTLLQKVIHSLPVVKLKRLDQPEMGLGLDTCTNIITEMLKQQ